MSQLRRPIAPQFAAASLGFKLVWSSEELIVDDLAGVDVPEILARFPRGVGVDCTAQEIVLAQSQRMKMGRLCSQSKPEDDRDFVTLSMTPPALSA